MTPREIIAQRFGQDCFECEMAADDHADMVLAELRRHGYVVESAEAIKRAAAILDLVGRHLRDVRDMQEKVLQHVKAAKEPAA